MEINGRESPTNRIWYCRKVLRIKQGTLAKKIGCARSTLSSWESGQSYPPVDMAVKLAKRLKCPLEDLYPNLFEKNLRKK
jgi:DNA-binding XRE family transcriptional regulator